MSLRSRKLASGKKSYFADYREGGKRRRKSFGVFDSRAAAKTAYVKWRYEYERGLQGLETAPGLTVGDCLDNYLAIKRGDCAAGHIESLEHGAKLIRGYFGQNKPVKSLSERTVSGFKTHLRARGNVPTTINKRLALLRAAIDKAVSEGALAANPINGVEKLSDPRPPSWRFLEVQEAARLLNVLQAGARVEVKRKNGRNYEAQARPNPVLYRLVLFMLNTGARRGEALALQWEDIDMDRGHIRLMTTKRAARGREALPRYVPINSTLREMFEVMGRGAVQERVFKIGLNNLRRKFERACELAGIEHCRIHDLRHTFASHLAMSGTPITVIRELLGHATLTMTLRYAHLTPSTKTRAVERLNFTSRGTTRIEEIG